MAKNPDNDEKPKLKRKQYEKELRRLQAELCKLQEWVKFKGLRIMIVFEGRDGAGKGGTIKAITERVSPRVFRVVALPAPTEREKSQLYIQRYMEHFPASGEIIILTAVGTTAPAWSMSWDFAPKSSTAAFSSFARTSKKSSSTRASISSSIGWKLAITNKSAVLKRV
jgi:hypothetical protein